MLHRCARLLCQWRKAVQPCCGATVAPMGMTSAPWSSLWLARRCCTTPTTPVSVGGSLTESKGNCFDFFGIPKHPEVDVAALQKRYHNLQRRVHPDQQQVQAQEQQQQTGSSSGIGMNTSAVEASNLDVSTYANVSYEVLRTPFTRCRYLSRLVKAAEVKGAPLTPAEEGDLLSEDDQRSLHARKVCPDAPLSDSFLMEMLSINELIFAGDPEDEAVRRQWAVLRFDLDDRAAGYFKDAVQFWDAGDMAQFHRTVQEWTYIDNAAHHVKERLLL